MHDWQSYNSALLRGKPGVDYLSGSVHKRRISPMVPRLNFGPGTDQEARNLGPPEVAGESKRAVTSVIARLLPKTMCGAADKRRMLQDGRR